MSNELVSWCSELLAPQGAVRARRMFGGHGFYLDEIFIAILAGERLYLKVDETTREAFVRAGSEPFGFTTARGERVVLGYFSAPAEAHGFAGANASLGAAGHGLGAAGQGQQASGQAACGQGSGAQACTAQALPAHRALSGGRQQGQAHPLAQVPRLCSHPVAVAQVQSLARPQHVVGQFAIAGQPHLAGAHVQVAVAHHGPAAHPFNVVNHHESPVQHLSDGRPSCPDGATVANALWRDD